MGLFKLLRQIILVIAVFGISFAWADLDDDDYSSSSSYSSSRSKGWGMGLASNSKMLYTSETALTGIHNLNREGQLQWYFVMTSSDPNLYGLGVAYKHTVSGNKSTGLHIGGGLGIGSFAQDRSFTRINGLVGVHFTVNKKVAIHMDGGLTITQDKNANGGTDSQTLIGGGSSMFGLSIVYMM